ncbi:MAG: adenine deaminase [Nitrosopumilus sp. B06]|nr:MAG: adenine deaminase [Nitrosopumilus sp. B06]
MHSDLADSISRLNSVATGSKKASLIIKDCRLLSVYTGETIPGTQVAISGDRIAYVGPDASHAAGPNTCIIDAKGRHVGPGLADPHIHIDQFVTPWEFAKKTLLCGVTSLFSDPIDMTGIAGYRGFCEFLNLCEGLPVRIFQTVPGGIPVDPKFSNSQSLSIRQQRSAARHRRVPGLGEVFSWTKVTSRDHTTMESLRNMLDADCIINGHTAGISEKKLNAYVSSGILSCHEPINFEQVIERLRLGMWVMIREGSIRRDLAEIIPEVISHKTYRDRLMFCSDGIDPLDLVRYGHIDYCMRESVRLGLEPADAAAMASRNVFEYYRMDRDLGGIAPGKLADIVIFAESFTPDTVLVGGRIVVSERKITARPKKKTIPSWLKKTVRLGRFSARDFEARSKKLQVTANTIRLQTEIITQPGSAQLVTRDGLVPASPDSDVWKVASFDRINSTGKSTVGFLENFGAEIGAFASTWCFHEGDMIVIGSNDSDMAVAANHLVRNQGGLVVVKSGRIAASMPLQIAGIVSSRTFEQVSADFEGITTTLADSGCRFPRPHMIPLFLPFLALPSIRILSGGIIDVKRRRYVRPFN